MDCIEVCNATAVLKTFFRWFLMKHEKEMIHLYIYIYIRKKISVKEDIRKKGVSQSSRGTKIAERFDEST